MDLDDVVIAEWDGPPIGAAEAIDLVVTALEAGVSTVALPVERLDPAFFDLRTGVAGEIVQKVVNYRLRLAVVGPLPPVALSSASFTAFMRESERSDVWFAATLDALRERLEAGS